MYSIYTTPPKLQARYLSVDRESVCSFRLNSLLNYSILPTFSIPSLRGATITTAGEFLDVIIQLQFNNVVLIPDYFLSSSSQLVAIKLVLLM
jgi:hypothetical protein